MIGSICSQFHWDVGYLLWGINWITVQIMLADMPWDDYEKKGPDSGNAQETLLSDLGTPESIKNFLDRING